VHQLVINH